MSLKILSQLHPNTILFLNNLSNETIYYKIIFFFIFFLFYVLFGFAIKFFVKKIYDKVFPHQYEEIKTALKSSFNKPLMIIYWSFFPYLLVYILYYLFSFGVNYLTLLSSLFKTLSVIFLNIGVFDFIKKIRGEFRTKEEKSNGNIISIFFLDACLIFIPFFSVMLIVEFFDFSDRSFYYIHFLIKIIFIISLSSLLIRGIFSIENYIKKKFNVNQSENLKSRTVLTQVIFFRKILIAAVIIIGVASILMVFAPFREIGTSLLASAGVATAIVGFAAQKTIANLFAGVQLAFSQPIRLYDVVVVEGELGKIDEITLTYIVVALWDQRRLVMPISYFMEKPFQNWTKETSEILGTVFIYCDYSLPVSKIEDEVKNICNQTTLWDRRVCVIHVTNMSHLGMEIRILVSSKDAAINFDLRCLIRRKIIEFIQNNYPQCFPNTKLYFENQNQKQSQA